MDHTRVRCIMATTATYFARKGEIMAAAVVTKSVDLKTQVTSVGKEENYYQQVLAVSLYQRTFVKSLINKMIETIEEYLSKRLIASIYVKPYDMEGDSIHVHMDAAIYSNSNDVRSVMALSNTNK